MGLEAGQIQDILIKVHDIKGTFLPSYFEIGPVVSDKKIFKVFYIAIKPYALMAIFFFFFFFLTNHDSLNKPGRG